MFGFFERELIRDRTGGGVNERGVRFGRPRKALFLPASGKPWHDYTLVRRRLISRGPIPLTPPRSGGWRELGTFRFLNFSQSEDPTNLAAPPTPVLRKSSESLRAAASGLGE
jgi:hypothetical protein